MKIVLQKFIADSGFCSRRRAEILIRVRRVFVNNKLAELGAKVDEDDEVRIDRKIIKPQSQKIYIALNKPLGYVCTNREFRGEKNVFALLRTSPHPSPWKGEGARERLFVVGRLDKNSRGLVLLTNDGDLTAHLTHPRYEHEKEYFVSINDSQLRITNEKEIIKHLKNGVDIGEGDGVVKAKRVECLGNNKFKIILTEGKKRQIRRMFRALDLEVIDLIRVRLHEIKLGNLKEGEWRYLSENEIKRLRN